MEIKNRPFDSQAGPMRGVYRVWVKDPTTGRHTRHLIRVHENNDVYWSDLVRVDPLTEFCLHCLSQQVHLLENGTYQCETCHIGYRIIEGF